MSHNHASILYERAMESVYSEIDSATRILGTVQSELEDLIVNDDDWNRIDALMCSVLNKLEDI